MAKSQTLGAAVRSAWRAPRGMKTPWLTQMVNSRKPALSRAAEAQRRYDLKACERMRKAQAKHNRAVRKYLRAVAKEATCGSS
jgi:hypothetical protein